MVCFKIEIPPARKKNGLLLLCICAKKHLEDLSFGFAFFFDKIFPQIRRWGGWEKTPTSELRYYVYQRTKQRKVR